MEHLAPRKSLGQNFLVDQNIARKIVETFAPRPDEPVVEIGPGQGALTGLLIERGARVLAVELDPRMAARIRELYADRVEVIEQDVLKINFAALAQAHNLERLRVIGNIPYYITSPILFRLIEFREVITEAMLMMQREVAMRLVAKGRTKDYGILSIMAQTYSDPRLLFSVGPRCFFPPPKVTSAVVKLAFKNPEGIEGITSEHRLLVRTAFNQRRKTLRNSLTQLIADNESRESVFERAGINPSARAEELSPDDYIRFAKIYAAYAADSR